MEQHEYIHAGLGIAAQNLNFSNTADACLVCMQRIQDLRTAIVEYKEWLMRVHELYLSNEEMNFYTEERQRVSIEARIHTFSPTNRKSCAYKTDCTRSLTTASSLKRDTLHFIDDDHFESDIELQRHAEIVAGICLEKQQYLKRLVLSPLTSVYQVTGTLASTAVAACANFGLLFGLVATAGQYGVAYRELSKEAALLKELEQKSLDYLSEAMEDNRLLVQTHLAKAGIMMADTDLHLVDSQ